MSLKLQPPTWRTRVSLFVWVITLDLFSMGGPTSGFDTTGIALLDHLTMEAPPLPHDTTGGGGEDVF